MAIRIDTLAEVIFPSLAVIRGIATFQKRNPNTYNLTKLLGGSVSYYDIGRDYGSLV